MSEKTLVIVSILKQSYALEKKGSFGIGEELQEVKFESWALVEQLPGRDATPEKFYSRRSKRASL